VIRLTLACLLLCAWPIVAAPPAISQATFRGGVALVSVEIQVVDSVGRPAEGLTPASFGVTIDGRRRQVVAAELVRDASASGLSEGAGAAPRPTRVGGGARTFVIAIDAASFSTGEAAGVVRVAQGFVDRVPDADAVGVVALPHGALVSPAAGRVAVKQALGTVTGLKGRESNPFNLTAAEVLDITAETGEMASGGPPQSGRSSVPNPSFAARQVQLRECRGTAEQVCLQNIVIEANALARQFQRQTTEGIAGLMRLLRLLGEFSGSKTVVLISAGMPVSDRSGGGWHRDGGEARALGQSAARANATVYAIHLDSGYRSVYNPEQRAARPNVSIARDREIEQLIMSDFSLASGGALFSMPTGPSEVPFDRILLETSAVYLLGVTPDARDFDGRPHELKVTVQDRGLTVRNRKFVMLHKEN
jgi:VWFA-related protein